MTWTAEELIAWLRSPQAGLMADERVQAAADMLERLTKNSAADRN
jgi:hypothetical protein